MELYMICTRLLVMDMVNPDIPRPTMRSSLPQSSLMAEGRSFRMVRLPVRKARIHRADSI